MFVQFVVYQFRVADPPVVTVGVEVVKEITQVRVAGLTVTVIGDDETVAPFELCPENIYDVVA